MNFNAKDDFVTEQEIRDEQEQLEETKRADEEDNGYDKKGLTEEQLYNFRQQNIKSIYAVLYSLGLEGKTDKVRHKLDLLSQFFGNIGGVSNITDEELAVIGHMLDNLKALNYKFTY